MEPTAKRIALLEDDPDQAELMRTWLAAAGFHVTTFDRGKRMLAGLLRESFDLLILDWNLPDLSGDQVLQEIRATRDRHIPVLFTTSRDAEEDIVHALESGADDYLVKPIRQMELLARIKALTRRGQALPGEREVLEFGTFRIDPAARQLQRDGQTIDLTDKEFDLVSFLFRNAGRLVSRSHILEAVWGMVADIDTRTVDVHVSRIRRKLQLGPQSGWCLTSVYQQGYRLEPAAADAAGNGLL